MNWSVETVSGKLYQMHIKRNLVYVTENIRKIKENHKNKVPKSIRKYDNNMHINTLKLEKQEKREIVKNNSVSENNTKKIAKKIR